MTALEVYVVGLAYKGLQIYVRWSLLRLVVVCPVVKKVSSLSHMYCPHAQKEKETKAVVTDQALPASLTARIHLSSSPLPPTTRGAFCSDERFSVAWTSAMFLALRSVIAFLRR